MFSQTGFEQNGYALSGFENATTRILQSKFFNSSFNTAIFDGPLRVYFTQQQENEAMKVYFSLQAKVLKEERAASHLRDFFPKDSTLFVMIYPDKEAFRESFNCDQDFSFEKMGQDYIIGVQGPISEKTKDDILNHIQEKFLIKNYEFR